MCVGVGVGVGEIDRQTETDRQRHTERGKTRQTDRKRGPFCSYSTHSSTTPQWTISRDGRS